VEAIMVMIAMVAVLLWVARRTSDDRGRRPAAPPPPGSSPKPDAAAEHEARQLAREDAAFIEGMVIGHYVWPARPEEKEREDDEGAHRDLHELAWADGDDVGIEPLDDGDDLDAFDGSGSHGSDGRDGFDALEAVEGFEEEDTGDGAWDDPWDAGFDEDDDGY
jgi:hypothetical protein